MTNRDIIKSIHDIGLCIQSMIKTRLRKNVRPIYTKGIYKSMFISFYRSPYDYQFFVEDKSNYYKIYLFRNEKIVRKAVINKEERVELFYQKMTNFFLTIN